MEDHEQERSPVGQSPVEEPVTRPTGPLKDAQATSVAIVAWQALPAIFPDRGTNIGGLELGAWRLARSLARRQEIEPSILVRSPRREPSCQVDGVQISIHSEFRSYVRQQVSAAIRGQQRRTARLLWQIPYLTATWPWRQRDSLPMAPDDRLAGYLPDVWIALGASRDSAAVVATAEAQQRPCLLLVQSNMDLDLGEGEGQADGYGENLKHRKFAIEKATQVGCQTQLQLQNLKRNFGRDGIIIPNATDDASWRPAIRHPGEYVLWMGRYDEFHKRPRLAIEIARRCPAVKFRMIVNRADDAVREQVIANCPSNVELIDYVPFDRLRKEFGEARMFLSTGSAAYEGFPTVLLQAVAAEKPIVSLEDFDHFIRDSESGVVCDEDLEVAAGAIRRLWDQPNQYDPAPATAYLRRHHEVASVARLVAAEITRLSEAA